MKLNLLAITTEFDNSGKPKCISPSGFLMAVPIWGLRFISVSSTDGRLARPVQSPTCVDSRTAQGLEAPPRTSTSHLEADLQPLNHGQNSA